MHNCLMNPAVRSSNALQQRLHSCGALPLVCRPVQPARDVVAYGILDSFRRERGLPIPGQQVSSNNSSTSTIEKPQLAKQRTARRPEEEEQVDDDEVPCPVECVTEVYTPEEFQQALDAAGPTALVVVDFFKTACGACKFIYPGFVNLCKASAQQQEARTPPVVFLKHNVYDDEEGEVTDLCKQYNVRSVPKFIFLKNGEQLDSFSTRDKKKVAEAIIKHAEPGSVELGDWTTQ